MDTQKLKYFSVIAQTENVRKAAEILKITPSALSKSVKQLEDELEVRLITPLGRGITLTREGRELAKQSVGILSSVTLLKDQIRSSKVAAEKMPLRIATFEVFSTYFLQALDDLENADRELVLHEVIPGELEQVIDQGKADFGITYLPIAHQNLEHIKITSIVMGVYKRKGAFKTVSQDKLPFVVPAYPLSGTPTRVKGLDGWPEDNYRRKIKFEVTLMESALELCRQGRCAGYFPSFVIERHNRKFRDSYALERHPFTRDSRRCYSDVFLVRRKDRTEDADMRFISKLIRLGTRLEKLD